MIFLFLLIICPIPKNIVTATVIVPATLIPTVNAIITTVITIAFFILFHFLSFSLLHLNYLFLLNFFFKN